MTAGVVPVTMYGIRIDPLTLEEVVARARQAMSTHGRLLIAVVNAAKVVHLRDDELLRDSLAQADVTVADGQSVVWASRVLGHRLPERVAGIDVFERLLEVAAEEGRSVFLLGARPEVLQTLVSRLADRRPTLRVAGYRDGYFTAAEADDVAAQVRASGADMLFLGITSPKKETFLARYADTLGVPVLHGVGGSFDVLAGVTRRAPDRWQRWGFEWAFRLLQEPRRLWRRYLVTNTRFVALTVRERLRRGPGTGRDTDEERGAA